MYDPGNHLIKFDAVKSQQAILPADDTGIVKHGYIILVLDRQDRQHIICRRSTLKTRTADRPV